MDVTKLDTGWIETRRGQASIPENTVMEMTAIH